MAIRSRVLFLCVVTLSFLLDSCSSGGGQLRLQHQTKNTRQKKRPKKKPTRASKESKPTEPTAAVQQQDQQPLIIPDLDAPPFAKRQQHISSPSYTWRPSTSFAQRSKTVSTPAAHRSSNSWAPVSKPATLPYAFKTRDGKLGTIVQKEGKWKATIFRPLTQDVVELPIVSRKPIGEALAAMPPYSPQYPSSHVHFRRSSEGKDYLFLGKMGLAGGNEGDEEDEDTGNTQPAAAPTGLWDKVFSFLRPKNTTEQGQTGFFTQRNPAPVGGRRPSIAEVGALLTSSNPIKTTEELADAMNNASSAEERATLQRWGKAYLQWFEDKSPREIHPEDLEELASFARLSPESAENRALISDFLALLHKKIREQEHLKTEFMGVLDYTLQTIDPETFEGNPKMLTDIAQGLLEKVDPKKGYLTYSTYPSYQHTLSALHQTMRLIHQVAPDTENKWKIEKDGLHAQFKEQLQAIKKAGKECYPFVYQSELLLQSLAQLEKEPSKTRERLRKTFYAAKGGYHLYKGVKGLCSFEFDVDEFIGACSSIQEALSDKAIKKEEWYNCLQAINDAVAATFIETEHFGALDASLEILEDLNIKSSKSSRKALHYGIVQQLGVLATSHPDEKIRGESLDWLNRLSGNKLWTKDNVVAALLKEAKLAAKKPFVPAPAPSNRVFEKVEAEIISATTSIEKYGRIIPPMPASAARQALKRHYRRVFKQLPLLFEDEEEVFSMDDVSFQMTREAADDDEGKSRDRGRARKPMQAAPKAKKKDKEDQLADQHARQQRSKKPIKLSELFKEGRKRVYIRGGAGTGKTTLVKKLAYDWAMGKYPEITNLYRLPVRALSKDKYDKLLGPLLAIAIANECYPRQKSDAAHEALVQRIIRELKDPNTVVIWDGMDEGEGASEAVLAEAVQGDYKSLLTSRTYGPQRLRGMVDLEVELQPMGKSQQKRYINRYLGAEEGRKLVQFLAERPELSKLAQVPVTLQILCALWKKEGARLKDTLTNSPSGLYNKLTNYIWERYALKRTDKELENVDRDKLFQTLGQVSLKALEQGEALVSPQTVSEVLERVPNNKEMERMLKGSDFLSAVGSRQEFKHLTFQEFFAGKELARMMLSESSKEQEDAAKFLKEHKYKAHYGVTLSFMAEEVCQKGGLEGIRRFLRALNEQSAEVGGPHHLFLQLKFLNEWLRTGGKNFDAEDCEKLEEEFGIIKAFEELIKEGLKEKNIIHRDRVLYDTILKALPALGHVLEKSSACEFLTKSADNWEQDIFIATATNVALGKVAQGAPERVEEILSILFKAGRHDKYRSAILFLGYRSWGPQGLLIEIAEAMPEKSLPVLLQALEEGEGQVNLATCLALEAIGQSASERAVPILTEALKHKDKKVRSAAIKALGKVAEADPNRAEEILHILLKVSEGKDYDIINLVANSLMSASQAVPEKALPVLLKASVHEVKKSGKGENICVLYSALAGLSGIVRAAPERFKEILPIIEQTNTHPNSGMRFQSAFILRNLVTAAPERAEEVFALLLKLSEDEDENVRMLATQELGRAAQVVPHKAEVVLPIIEKLFKSENDEARRIAVFALSKVAQGSPEYIPGILPLLQEALGDKEFNVSGEAEWVLGNIAQIAPEPVLALLEELLEDEECSYHVFGTLEEVVEAAPEQAEVVFQFLKRVSKDNFKYAAKTLGAIVQAMPQLAEEVIPLLEKILPMDRSMMKKGAFGALESIAQAAPHTFPTVLPMLLKAMKDYDYEGYTDPYDEHMGEALAIFSTQQLLAYYLINPSADRLVPFLKKRLYKEPLVIRPSRKYGKKELVLYPASGKPAKWQVADAEAERLQKIFQ